MIFFKILRKILLFLAIPIIILLVANFWVVASTNSQIYTSIDTIPTSEVGLILGTSKRTSEGAVNTYFEERIDAASELYHAKKIRYIIVSGDNRTVYYNEPMDMLNALLKRNVPKEDVIMDYAGLSTFESVNRAKDVFGKTDLTIITQNFHCHRAVYLANQADIQSRAYAADANNPLSNKLAIREVLARLKAVIEASMS